jgi:hypothetical protein
MADFANSISSKCEEEDRPKSGDTEQIRRPPPPPPEPGLATILGNWVMPRDSDDAERAVSSDTAESKEKKPTPVQGITIYLCKSPDSPNSILGQIRKFGAEKGLAWEGLGQYGSTHGWPANHIQAEQLCGIIDNSARSISKRTTLTDKYGDYKFEGVPKGDYLLYASLCTKKQCNLAHSEKRFQFRECSSTDMTFSKHRHKIWRWTSSAPNTPKEYFKGIRC